MRRSIRWTAAAIIAALSTSSLAAQGGGSHANRQGFYASIGVGEGWESVSCTGCTSTSESAVSGYLAFGGTLSPQWRLGFEANAWRKSLGGTTLTQEFYSAALALYPSKTVDFWIKADVGYATISASGGGGSESGFAAGVGIGYDWHPGSGALAIIPYANFLQQVVADKGDKWRLIQLGVGIGYKH
jgi:hypothetical protein